MLIDLHLRPIYMVMDDGIDDTKYYEEWCEEEHTKHCAYTVEGGMEDPTHMAISPFVQVLVWLLEWEINDEVFDEQQREEFEHHGLTCSVCSW